MKILAFIAAILIAVVSFADDIIVTEATTISVAAAPGTVYLIKPGVEFSITVEAAHDISVVNEGEYKGWRRCEFLATPEQPK